MRFFTNVILTVLISFVAFLAKSQDFSNKGREFWVVFPPHQPGTASGSPSLADLSLYLTSDKNSAATIFINGVSFGRFTVTANVTQEIVLPRALTYISETESASSANLLRVVSGKSIKVVVDQGMPPIVVYAHMYAGTRSAASIILPTSVLDKRYLVSSYKQTSNGIVENEEAKSQFSVIATEDNTKIRITPRKDGVLAGAIYEVVLPKAGDIYQFQDDQDLTGSEIESISDGVNQCKKVAVFSGSSALHIPDTQTGTGTSLDPLYQECYPTNSWGLNYFITPFRGKDKAIFRIMAQQDGTNIAYNNKFKTLNKGEFFESNSIDDPLPVYIQSLNKKPIAVTQFAYTQIQDQGVGDPEMIILNAIEQNIKDVTVFLSPKKAIVDQNINVIIKNTGIASFKINGNLPKSRFIQIGSTGFSYLQENFPNVNSILSVKMSSDSGFNAFCYGFGQNESYGYSAGTNVKDLNQFIEVKNPNAVVKFPATCKGTPFNLSITLPYKPTKLQWDFKGNADLGPNPPALQNPDGSPLNPTQIIKSVIDPTMDLYVYKLTSPYTFTQVGTYNINVIVVNPTADGCTGEQVINYDIEVFDAPLVDFTIDSVGCNYGPIKFIANATTDQKVIKYLWNFDASATDTTTTNIITKTFPTSGIKVARVKAVTEIGCLSPEFKIDYELFPLPTGDFTIDNPFCQGDSIKFTSTIQANSGTIKYYNWNLDNDSLSLMTGPIVYTKYTKRDSLVKQLSLVVENSKGCKKTITKSLFLNTHATIDFTLPEVCLKDAFASFAATASSPDSNKVFSYLWNFGDPNADPAQPNVGVGPTATHKYKASQQYLVNLLVTAKTGCQDSLQKVFTVNGNLPNADFQILNTNGQCSNKRIFIKNKSSVDFGSITKLEVLWDPNNLTSDTINIPYPNYDYSHQYPTFTSPTQKTYTIKLRAYSGGSCFAEKSDIVTVNASPVVNFPAIPGFCLESTPRKIDSVLFIDVAGIPPGSGTFTEDTVTFSNFIYFDPTQRGVGQYPITYRYTSSNQCYDEKTNTVVVWPKPEANFYYSAVQCENIPIKFSDNSITGAGTVAVSNWVFNDNNNTPVAISGNPINRTYLSPGNYNIHHDIVTSNGCKSESVSKIISVHFTPVADFELPIVCKPEGKGVFINKSTITDGSSLKYKWEFGDTLQPATSLLQDGIHYFKNIQPYTIKLTATSQFNCPAERIKVLKTIYNQSKASFTSIDATCVGSPIQFTNTSQSVNGSFSEYHWILANKVEYKEKNPIITFNNRGDANIKFFAKDSIGCYTDTLQKTIKIYDYPKVDAGPDFYVLEDAQKLINASATGQSLIFSWEPQTYLSRADTLTPFVIMPKEDIVYTLTAIGLGNCKSTDAVKIFSLKKPTPPNTFTPNGDGINDTWEIQFLSKYTGCIVEVYTPQGQLVFKSIGYSTPWDGTYNGKQLPAGTYYYVIDPKNDRNKIAGYVTIFK